MEKALNDENMPTPEMRKSIQNSVGIHNIQNKDT